MALCLQLSFQLPNLSKVAKRVKGNTFINNCNLCISEKVFTIGNLDEVDMLNKMSEFISKCPQINKRLLNKVKDDSVIMIDFDVCLFLLQFFLYYGIFLFL